EFTVKIPANFAHTDTLVTTIHYITKTMTMGNIGGPSNLLNFIAHYLKSPPWQNINPECYQYSLYINRTLIEQLSSQGQAETAAKIAIGSIKGLAHYGLDDYSRDQGMASLLNTSTNQIKKALISHPSLAQDLFNLLQEPDVQKK